MGDIELQPLLSPPATAAEPPPGRWGRLYERVLSLARRLKRDLTALWIASSDSRVPLLAKLTATFVLAMALSPIDVIPDFIPVLGLLDDLLLVPLGIWLSIRLIPPEVWSDAQAEATRREESGEGVRLPTNYCAAAVVVALWIGFSVWIGITAWKWFVNRKTA